MNSSNLIILAVYLGSIFGHGMIKQAEAPPAQTTQSAQTPPADQSTPPGQTPPADQGAKPAQTPPADQSAPPAQTPPADQSAQPAQTPSVPQTVQAPAATGAAIAPAVDSYVIGAADVLLITVWKEPTLSGSILVRPDGMISLSLLGDVQASGMTPIQLSGQIATKLKKYIQDPNVSVVVSQIHSKVVYLLGEVAKKGPVEMTPGMTLLEAISSAGGLTDFANQKKIYILRSDTGAQQRIPVRYKQALKGDGTLNLALKPGDTIVVP